MEKHLELYKKWAPDTAMWTQWAKPVVFMNMGTTRVYQKKNSEQTASRWIDYRKKCMVIVDLAEGEGIREGLFLAKRGFRPVPLYNGVPGGANAVVPMAGIVDGLWQGGAVLEKILLSDKANPAFLLDSNRCKGAKKKPGTFDNRWCVVPQDLPSASYLMKHGIEEVVVRTEALESDLKPILYKYQKQGMRVSTCDLKNGIRLKTIAKPKNVGLFYRFILLLGLARSASGGFGMSIPEVSSGGGGYRAG